MKRICLSTTIIILMSSSLFASYKEALELYKAKRYEESLKIIADQLRVEEDMRPDSQNYKLRFLAAHNHWKLGNSHGVISHFKKCINIQKDNVDPIIDLSLFFIERRRYGDARYFAQRALKVEKTSLAYYVLAKAALGYRNYSRAKEYFEKAIAIEPDLSIAYNGMGIVLMRLKQYNYANTAFSAAMAMMPDSPYILNNVAISLEKTGKFKDAYRYLIMAIAKNPDDPVIQENLNRVKRGMEKGY